MADTGVLPFVRGIDFTRNNFSDDKFPYHVTDMVGLRWLSLNRTGLDNLPYEISNLSKLEALSADRNNLRSIHTDVCNLTNLRVLRCRHNRIKNDGVPSELFDLPEISVMDLSHNQLKEVPEGLQNATNLLVLNLNHNFIETIPNPLFINLTDLIYLDLGNNNLETLPPQMRRLTSLQILVISNNPFTHANLRQLPGLTTLDTLHMANTSRSLSNFPANFEALVNLRDLDLSNNQLPSIPDPVYRLRSLARLNLSDNNIDLVSSMIEHLPLESLNLSRNNISELPASLCKLSRLKKLSLNSNQLQFSGIPAGIGKLCSLETFSASDNNLEMIPEGVCRCGHLKKLILNGNRLITLPDAIHYLTDLEVLDVDDNPDLVFPPKPVELMKGSGIEYYNIDFSLQHQLQLAGATPATATTDDTPRKKDAHARLKRLRRRKDTDQDKNQDSFKVLKGMQDVAKDKNSQVAAEVEDGMPIKAKRWDEALERPNLDYSEIFDDDVGHMEGLNCWEIENFLPNLMSPALHGKFYDGDCYIVLHTSKDCKDNLIWKIWYWIGQNATLDKKACAAIHAVNLRNLLGADCRTIREEQDDETDEFLDLFENGLLYIEGGRTCSGFYSVEGPAHQNRLYRVSERKTLTMDPCLLATTSLDHRHVFILDMKHHIYVWMGKNSKLMIRSKARLMAERMNKSEYKAKAEVVSVSQGFEEEDFWQVFGGAPTHPIVEGVVEVIEAPMILYKVGLGMGYLELPQVDVPNNTLTQDLLNTKHVYILDSHNDVFIWIGKKSSRLERAAALKLAQETHGLLNRPPYAGVVRCLERTEPISFKSKFKGWNDVIPVDFTRTSESVLRRGADLKAIMQRDQIKTNLSALFMPRQSSMNVDEAEQLMEEWNDDLDGMEAFVLEGRKFVRLPENEIGVWIDVSASHLNSAFCYILKVPFNNAESEGIVYVWVGKLASPDEARTAEDIAESIFASTYSVQILNEGEEPENFFWVGIGGRKAYSEGAEYMKHLRLFRCSNEKGYFTVSEKCSDFCQDDLADEDVMILDNGQQVFLWIGTKTSDVEIKLAFKSAQVYIQHLRNKQPNLPRKLLLSLKYRESQPFIKCFHAWSTYKQVPA